MIISVASGKGGTGKTTVATNLALAIGKDAQLLDCDVEEPNAHLFIQPVFEHRHIITTPVPRIDMTACSLCGQCTQLCQYKAIVQIADQVLVFDELCHSCGGCQAVCPESAISEKDRELGCLELGYRDGLSFIHGRLRVGETMAPPLIQAVRSQVNAAKVIIIDAPPGTSCPVITAMKNTDFVLLVTEPTPFGLHDLKLAVEAVKRLGIAHGLIINRADIGDRRVHEYARHENVPLLMDIPFDRNIAEIYARGEMLVEVLPQWQAFFQDLYLRIVELTAASGKMQ